MNILDTLEYKDKPSVSVVDKTEVSKIMAIGLGKGGILPNHTTDLHTTLVVLEGSIAFNIKTESLMLRKGDVYSIPKNEPHEVSGIEERNAFLLYQELAK